ncbi:DUF2244 domain-containing protein [uncultured Massilia sp.]|uniref:DUF2244 domain-containing protein n=1 Tax=uncultured Massilia sp. TaxID=169973 RepID=UPI0025DCF418|nr:DUF2244 domain-containing protein [uncultured Massilia sp.]
MHREWTLQRNCSLAPRQVALAYAGLCAAALAVGIAFLARGVWQVLAFTLVELALVGTALLLYARHATDHERIALSDDGLLVECVRADRRSTVRLDPLWTRVGLADGAPALLWLESRGTRVAIGRFVGEARRRQVARELRQALRGMSAMG